jgi:hypothetical protein
MLNDIRLHVDPDEQRQCEHETVFAKTMRDREKTNYEAFSRYIPSIAQAIVRFNCQRLSVFVDKSGQSNIVNMANGVVLYDMPVDKNMAVQTQNWPSCSAMLCIQKDSEKNVPAPDMPVLNDDSFNSSQLYTRNLYDKYAEQTVDALVVLGLGKGDFLPLLLSEIPVKQVVIYEPDWEVFKCSFMLFDWARFLEEAEQQGIQLFLQIGDNIQHIFEEINELYSQLGSKRFIFYRHILNETNNTILKNIRCGRWDKNITQEASLSNRQVTQDANFTEIDKHNHLQHFLKFTNCLATESLQNVNNEGPLHLDSLFTTNMALFKKFYPDIYEAFADYQPKCWETIANLTSGEINLFNRQHQSFYSGDLPKKEGETLARHFAAQPNLDGLVFGYEGDKLKHFLHNRFTRKADLLLKRHNLDKTELPMSVKVLLVIGLGSGYALEALTSEHDIQNLCICEPNTDFFYAALHAIDWQPIFDKLQKLNGKLYINLGESSSLLFKDLTSQFVGIGPHLLNETYIMQAYSNPLLNNVLKEVRQQLQVIFSMGENLDHVMYGIAHSAQAIKDRVPILRAQAKQKLSIADRQQAIFIVGNGPSLDESIESIKEYGNQAIVISCGTALQSLHRNGICPDFHAEVEQNRANYDWACRIDDFEYLKKISLLSICGAHPDTYGLYKDVYLCFKVGESSTQAITSMLPNIDFAYLENAYPTVTNFVTSLVLSMGFEQIYLHGVDLGYLDPDNHHSQSSAYYEDGKQVYKHKRLFVGSITTKGNREPWVNTKTEFNISRMIFEQSLSQYKADCFNTSNGAFITGSIPLLPEDTLVVNTPQQKQTTLHNFVSCFESIECDIEKLFHEAYSQTLMATQLAKLTKLSTQILDKEITDKKQVNELIDELRALMIDARKRGGSLFFYYMFNSVNYLCAVLSKALMFPDLSISLGNCRSILSDWNILVSDFTRFMQHQFTLQDTAECHSNKHELNVLKQSPIKVRYYSTSDFYNQQCLQYCQEQNIGAISITISPTSHTKLSKNEFLYIDIVSEDKILEVLTDLQNSHIGKACVNQVCFVVHDYRHLLKLKSLCIDTHYADACFMFLSLLWQPDIECSPLLSQICESGYQDYVPRNDFFDFLCARAADITDFSTIMFKPILAERSMYLPVFSETNRQQAYAEYVNEVEEKIQFVENISNFDHLYDVDFDFSALYCSLSSTINARALIGQHASDSLAMHQQKQILRLFEIDKAPESVRDEFQAHASQVIDNKFSQHIDFDCCYSFKCYCGVKRGSRNQAIAEVTLLDRCGNRGVLVRRKLLNYELQVKWHVD